MDFINMEKSHIISGMPNGVRPIRVVPHTKSVREAKNWRARWQRFEKQFAALHAASARIPSRSTWRKTHRNRSSFLPGG